MAAVIAARHQPANQARNRVARLLLVLFVPTWAAGKPQRVSGFTAARFRVSPDV
jgi:hypothetical protein